MSLQPFLSLLRRPGVARLVLISMLTKLPHAAMGVAITMHVVSTLGRSYFQAGILVMAFTIGAFFGGPWRGRTVDRKGLRRALIPSVAIETVVWISAPFVPYEVFVGGAFIGGLFMTPVFSLVRQALAVLVPETEQHSAFALDAVATELIFMFGPMIGILLYEYLGTREALVIIGAAVVAGGLLFMWFNPPTTSVQWAARQRAKGLTVEGESLDAAMAAFDLTSPAGAVGEMASESPQPSAALPHATTEFAEDPVATPASTKSVMTAAVFAVLGASAAASLILSGTDVSLVALLRQWDQSTSIGFAMMFWAFGSLVGGVLYGAMNRAWNPLLMVFALSVVTVPLGLAASLPVLYVLVFVAGLLCAPAISSINATLVSLIPENRRGEVMGWNGSASTVGSSIGSPAVGAVIDGLSPGAGFFAAGGVGLVLSVIGLGMSRRSRRTLSSPDPRGL